MEEISSILLELSSEVYTSKVKPLYTAFSHRIKLSGYRLALKFDKDPLALE